MTSCCSVTAGPIEACPVCALVGPVVGEDPVRAHRPDAADGAWRHCATKGCPVVFYLDGATVDDNAVANQVGHKALRQPVPVCFCFAHTAAEIVADAAAHDGSSTIKAAVKQAVADGHCACEHLNPSTTCCLPEIHRTLTTTATTN